MKRIPLQTIILSLLLSTFLACGSSSGTSIHPAGTSMHLAATGSFTATFTEAGGTCTSGSAAYVTPYFQGHWIQTLSGTTYILELHILNVTVHPPYTLDNGIALFTIDILGDHPTYWGITSTGGSITVTLNSNQHSGTLQAHLINTRDPRQSEDVSGTFKC